MANRVNKKFVIILAGSVVASCLLLAVVASYVLSRRGPALVAEGDRLYAVGEYSEAASRYSRAVYRNQTNNEWLLKWRSALLKTTPRSQGEYEQAYNQYLTLMQRMAQNQPGNAEIQLEYLSMIDERTRRFDAGTEQGLLTMVNLINERLTALNGAIAQMGSGPVKEEAERGRDLIRGLRGLAGASRIERTHVEPEEVESILEDLSVAYEADPEDWRYPAAIARINREQHQRLVLAGRALPDEIESSAQRARDSLAYVVTRFGDIPQVGFLKLQSDANALLGRAASLDARRDAILQIRGDLGNFLESMTLEAAGDLDSDFLGQIAPIAMRFGDREHYAQLLEVFTIAVSQQPHNPQLIFVKAEILRSLGRFDDAMQTFASIRELERPPLSLEGVVLNDFRLLSLNGQVETLIAQYESQTDQKQREATLARAKELLEELRTQTGVRFEDRVLRRTGEIALLEGDSAEAVSIFSELRRRVGVDDPSVMRPLAQALIRQGNFGSARQIFDDLLAAGFRDARTLFVTAELEFNLRNFSRAKELLEEGLRQDPGNAAAAERLALVNAALSGDASGLDQINPFVAGIIEARRLVASGEVENARQILERLAESNPGDVRVVRELVNLDLGADDRERALQRIATALEVNPRDPQLRAMRESVAEQDPLQAALRIVAQSDADEFEQAMGRFVVYSRFGMEGEADREFRAAERIRPRDPRLIQVGFERALMSNTPESLTDAERYVAIAMEQRGDDRSGLIMRGRLELARGNAEAAERTLSEVVDQIPYDPFARRFLGLAQRANGRMDAAIESLRRAYEGKPDDPGIAVDYASTLAATGRGAEAIRVLSPEEGYLRFDSSSDRVGQIWLALEAEHGDRQRVIDVRSRFFEREPGNLANSAAYIDLLMRENLWTEADDALRTVETTEGFDPLAAARLRAVWHARQGEVDRGREVLAAHIQSIPASERSVRPYLVAAEFETEAGEVQNAVQWLERGREYQSSTRAEVDRQLGDVFYSQAQQIEQVLANISPQNEPENHRLLSEERSELLNRAIQSYQQVVRLAGSDRDTTVVKRLAEAQLRAGNLDDVARTLQGLPENDLQVMFLRAGIAEQRNDLRSARQILDRAVEAHPNQPTAFVRRAALNINDSARFPDVVADLDRATKLRPGDTQAWGMLFQAYQMRGEPDAAIAILRQAIENNPENAQLKRLAVNVLAQQGRTSDALGMAAGFARNAPDDPEWQSRAGLLAYQMERYREAADFYRRLYDLDPSPANAADLLNSLLRSSPRPSRADINRLLPDVRKAPDNWRIKMLLARAQTFLGDEQDADRLTISAYQEAVRPFREWEAMGDDRPIIRQISQDPQIEVAGWFSTLVARYDDDIAKAMAFIERTSALRPLPPMLRLYPIQRDIGAGRDPSAILSALNEQERTATLTPFSALLYHRLRNQVLYTLGDYQGVVYACRAGLELAPNDVELNNNLAYTLAKHLDDAQAALPYAAVAERVAPQNAAVLDTVGWVYLQVGRHQDADRVLERAVNFAASPAERLPALVHRGFAKLELGDAEAAERMLRDARLAWDAAPVNVRNLYASELEQLEQRLLTR
ncbi:MAG: hypothetical protein EA380_11175 [Phycisphaeraceae bacterium]|nr:MAG: hypothetical protein EA380_11175 [Phycisphaeraceae bacterium]